MKIKIKKYKIDEFIKKNNFFFKSKRHLKNRDPRCLASGH